MILKEVFSSSSTFQTVLLVKKNFVPGPSSRPSAWIDDIEKKKTSNNSYSSLLASITDHYENNNLLMLSTNQTMFLSSPFDYQFHNGTQLSPSSSPSSSTLISVVLGVILFTITIWTILGNILVILAFVLDKQIRQGGMSNYLIINLAISDLLLGIAVLPFSASYSTFGIWYFGKFLCEFWLAIDVLCSTASIWVRRKEWNCEERRRTVLLFEGLLMIAFDRYIATNYPIRYRHHRHSIRLALSYICVAWFVSLAICLLPTLFFEKKVPIVSSSQNRTLFVSPTKYTSTNRQCELYKDLKFVLISSLLSFYIPLIIMIFLYVKVLYAIRQQSRKMKKKTNTGELLPRKRDAENAPCYADPSSKRAFLSCCFSDPPSPLANEDLSPGDQQQQQPLGRREITAEARVTRSLAIVIGCFICCWLPFFTLYIIRAVCLCLSFNAIEFFVWLGYSNSSINPVLYAILNKNFRLAFKNIFLSMKKGLFCL